MHCAALGLREQRWQAAWASEHGSRNGCHTGNSHGNATNLTVSKSTRIRLFRCAKLMARQCMSMLCWFGP